MNLQRAIRLHRGSPRRGKRRWRKRRHDSATTSTWMASKTGSVIMKVSNTSITSRARFANNVHSISSWVRRDRQRPGTQTNRLSAPHALLPARLIDFVSLTKPEVLLLVLITTAAGVVMASALVDPLILSDALVGTALVAGGTAALNHL